MPRCLPSLVAVLWAGACWALPSAPAPHARQSALVLGRNDTGTESGWSLLTQWSESAPSVARVIQEQDSLTLLTSTFHPFGKDPIHRVANLSAVVSGQQTAKVEELVADLTWCNMLQPLDAKVLGPSLVLTAGGFLVPGKSNGYVGLLNTTSGSTSTLISGSDGLFYHRAVVYDVNGDGRADVVAARAKVPTLPWKQKEAQLIWLEQPSSDPLGKAWQEHVLTTGPDVDFALVDLDKDGKPEVIATQFFKSPAVVLYWCEEERWSDCDASSVKSRVIDDENGPFFSVQVADMNMDGSLDLLISNNKADGSGSVFVYEVPADIRTGNFTRHMIATGYKPHGSGPGKGAPGFSMPFHPVPSSSTTTRPLVLLSGDDAGFVSVLTPTSQDQYNWTYKEQVLATSTGTIGTFDVADIDGNGVLDIVVPMFSDNLVQVYGLQG